MLLCWSAIAAELPDNFPDDIPIADFLALESSLQQGDILMVDFHAPGQTIDNVIESLIQDMASAGWNNTSNTGSPQSRILVFMKGERRCGIRVRDFVMDAAMQMDNSTKLVQMQISGGSESGDEGVAPMSTTAGEDESNE